MNRPLGELMGWVFTPFVSDEETLVDLPNRYGEWERDGRRFMGRYSDTSWVTPDAMLTWLRKQEQFISLVAVAPNADVAVTLRKPGGHRWRRGKLIRGATLYEALEAAVRAVTS